MSRSNSIARRVTSAIMLCVQKNEAMLFDLDMSIIRLSGDHPEHPSVVSLTALYHNLLRQWAEI